MLAGLPARRLVAAALTVLSAGLLTACHSADDAGSAYGPSTSSSAAAESGPTTGPSTAPGPPGQVPWSQVGPGWVLAVYATAATEVRDGTDTLYLLDPAGHRYVLHRYGVTEGHDMRLEDWSVPARRALLRVPSSEIDLTSGAALSLGSPSLDTALFSQPHGHDIISPSVPGAAAGELDELTLTGQKVKVLAAGPVTDWPAYAPGDAMLAIGERNGVALVNTGDGRNRWLRVPAPGGATCAVARWWNASTILAACSAGAGSRGLWLVPAGGAQPTLLAAAGQDPVAAWQLPSGRYLQVMTAQQQGAIARESANGSLSRIPVPGTGTIQVLTAQGARLLVLGAGFGTTPGGLPGITGGYSLLWFDPATGAEQWLFKGSAAERDVISAVPFPTIDSVHNSGL